MSSNCFCTVLLESFSAGFTNVSRCFLYGKSTGFQVSVSLTLSILGSGVLWDFFPQIIHPCFDLSTLSVRFTVKITTRTCKRRNNFVSTVIVHNFDLVFEEWRGFERSLCAARTSAYTHRNSNLVHAQTECPSA